MSTIQIYGWILLGLLNINKIKENTKTQEAIMFMQKQVLRDMLHMTQIKDFVLVKLI